MSKPLTPFEWLFGLALNLERGEMHVLDGSRVAQHFAPDPNLGRSLISIDYDLLGEDFTVRCQWPTLIRPTGPLELRGIAREKAIRAALDILTRQIATAIATKEGDHGKA